jgi:hypothetical protein
MSSATSIDRADARVTERDPKRPDVFKPWHFFVLASLITATAAVVVARQSGPEHLVMISLTIGAAGFAAGALYLTLAPLVGSDAANPPGELSEGMRAVLEREKQLTLRSIKELEFDRAMGKLSPKDFEEMAGRLRARAISLMKQLDAEAGYRELIERELAARMRRPALKNPAPSSGAAAPVSPAVTATCACGTANDPDAAFCKRCGTRLIRAAGG